MGRERIGRQRGEGAFGAIIGITLLVLGCIAAFKVVPLHMKGNDVFDAMTEAANFGSLKPEDKLRWEIYKRAQDDSVPLPMDAIKITKTGSAITISAKYEQTVNVLGYQYKYVFDRSVEKPTF